MPFLPACLTVQAPTDGADEPEHTALILHGILGSAANWRSFARRLVAAAPGWRVVAVDLRNHGDSTGAPAPHTLAACAEDLVRLAASEGWSPALVAGHSFGGKVALAYGARGPAGLREVWALDSAPGAWPAVARSAEVKASGGGEIATVLAALDEVAQPLASREAIVALLTARGLSPAIGRWMTTNLRREGEGYVWRFDLDGVREMVRDYMARDLWSVVESPPDPRLRVGLVRAGQGGRWSPAEVARLEAAARLPHVEVTVLPESGHWVHVDAPAELLSLLTEALQRAGRAA